MAVATFPVTAPSIGAAAADAPVWVPANTMTLVSGTPALVINNGRVYMNFGPDTDDVVASTFVVPLTWLTFGIAILTYAISGSTGNVVWRGDITGNTLTDAISAVPAVGTNNTGSIPNGVLKSTTIRSGVVGGSDIYSMTIRRVGSVGTDTATNPSMLAGVRLIRQS